jgi:hypothetical protein
MLALYLNPTEKSQKEARKNACYPAFSLIYGQKKKRRGP